MTKNKLVWRLSKLPTVEELLALVKDKLITQDEAKEILFNLESVEDRDKKSLESEVKFLRELVEHLAQGRDRIVEVIKEVKVPYYQYPWYKPYEIWCGNGLSNMSLYAKNSSLDNLTQQATSMLNIDFKDIKTF